MRRVLTIGMALLMLAMLAACGGDGDDTSELPSGGTAETSDNASGEPTSDTPADDTPADSTPADGTPDDDETPTGAAPSGIAGTLTLGDDVITVDSAMCHLEPQDAAAGGGQILLTVVAFGSMPDGEPFILDVTRFDEDSMFHGDSISVDVGDPMGDDAYSWIADSPVGTVTVEGSAVSATDLTFTNFAEGTELAGAIEVDCG